MDRLEKEEEKSTNIVILVKLGLTQYLFVCQSQVTHWFNYQAPQGSVKTSVSVWYDTGCIFVPDPIKTLEKRLPTFLLATKRAKRKRDLWCGQVTVSVYLLAVNTVTLFFLRLEADTALGE